MAVSAAATLVAGGWHRQVCLANTRQMVVVAWRVIAATRRGGVAKDDTKTRKNIYMYEFGVYVAP